MGIFSTTKDLAGFDSAQPWIGSLTPDAAARLIAAASDIALVLDPDGTVRDVSCSPNDPLPSNAEEWIGRRWGDLVTAESRGKVADLLRDAALSMPTRGREINHLVAGKQDLPIRYVAVRLQDDGPILAIGRDLRSVAAAQQRLVETQLSLDREYTKLRSAETRYRLMFQLSGEAVIIVDERSERVSDVNSAAARLFGGAPGRFIGMGFAELFSAAAAPAIKDLFAAARTLGQAGEVRAAQAGGRPDVILSASLIRDTNATQLLVRSTPAERGTSVSQARRARTLDVIEQLPDGFVVVDAAQCVVEANPAFLAMAEIATAARAKGTPIEKWLGRPGVDANILLANLREHGSIRDFATILRGEFGGLEQVEVTGVAVPDETNPSFGLVVRSARRRVTPVAPNSGPLFRSVEQFTDLVGRVPLKDVIRETTDLVERLCIESALKLTDDNRASAAQVLGLSRQGLYAKLHRYGLLRDGEAVDAAGLDVSDA